MCMEIMKLITLFHELWSLSKGEVYCISCYRDKHDDSASFVTTCALVTDTFLYVSISTPT